MSLIFCPGIFCSGIFYPGIFCPVTIIVDEKVIHRLFYIIRTHMLSNTILTLITSDQAGSLPSEIINNNL